MNEELYTLIVDGNFGRSEFIQFTDREKMKKLMLRYIHRQSHCYIIPGAVSLVNFRVTNNKENIILEDEPGYTEK